MATAGEILDRIVDNLELAGQTPPERGTLLRRVETAHQRIARDLQVPRRYIKGVDATTPFELPSEARPTGLLYIEKENALGEAQMHVPLLTVDEANRRGIQWDVTDSDLSEYRGDPRMGRYLAIYDPANISAPIYPLGFETGDKLRILYIKKPAVLASGNIEPFDGIIPEFAGDLLVQYVTFEVMLARGMDQAQAFYNDYLGLRESAFGAIRPTPWLPAAPGEGAMG